jgi:AraC-like DNA-binding protein
MSRADDQLTLRILDHFRKGWSVSMIARAVHLSKSGVHARITRVVADDTQHDPEARQYWRRDKGDPT